MIISHTHQYIFFAVPKTATHSVREALRLTKSPDDWEQQVLFGKQSIPLADIAKIKHGHISAREIQAALDSEQWRNYFKFAFVRNPYDRFVSICSFLNRQNPEFKSNALVWMKTATQRAVFRDRVLVRPQYEQLIDESGLMVMDYVGRYEALQESMDFVNEALNCPLTPLQLKNTSAHEDYRYYYDDELFELVSDFYKKDIDYFDYEF